jgi:hypothetical protein
VAEGYPDYNLLSSTGISGRAFAGYQFSPVLGLRGLATLQGHRWEDTFTGPDTLRSFGSQALMIDLMLNLSNLFFGYSLNAPLDISLYAGTGVLHRNIMNNSPGLFSYVARGGMQFDYRLNQQIELNLLAEINAANDNFNGLTGGTGFDLFPGVMLGITWHFRTTKPFRRTCCD